MRSQMVPARLSVLDFSPAGMVIKMGRTPANVRLFFTRSANSGATLLSEIMAHVLRRKNFRVELPSRAIKPESTNTRYLCTLTQIPRMVQIKDPEETNGTARPDHLPGLSSE